MYLIDGKQNGDWQLVTGDWQNLSQKLVEFPENYLDLNKAENHCITLRNSAGSAGKNKLSNLSGGLVVSS